MPKPRGYSISGTRCFPKDLNRIQVLARIMAAKEEAGFNQEHVISRALTALEEKMRVIHGPDLLVSITSESPE